jgi:hypothetical protein
MTIGMAAPAVFAGGDEQKVGLDQVPPAVKAAFEKEAKGGAIGDVVKETEKGKTFYEAQISKNGKDRFVHVREDGKVIKRESAKKEAKEDAKEAKRSMK